MYDSTFENNYDEIKHESDETFTDSDRESTNSDIKQEYDNILDWYKILKYTSEKNENGFYECISCDELYDNHAELKKHMRAHKKFACKVCLKNFTILSNLRRHLRTHGDSNDNTNNSDSQNNFKCIACTKTFTKRKHLSQHLKSHTIFGCPQCSAKFTFATNLRKHLQRHNRPKDEIRIYKPVAVEKRTCDICFKVFKFRLSMLKHRRNHEITGKTCKYCNEIFENSIQLYKHMEELHENEKNVVCAICNKKFFREWNLKMHMIVHSGLKPFMCEICGASFALGGNLVIFIYLFFNTVFKYILLEF